MKTLSLLALLVLAACSGGEKPAAAPDAPSPHLLASDLPGALSVLEAKKAEAGREIVLVGRVALVANGTFRLVDDSLDYCGRGEDTMDSCETPWDYCCIDPTKVANSTIVVQAKTKSGTDVPKREMGIRPMDLVALKGTTAKNDFGALVVVAQDGWYRRDRPPVPDYVKFPD